MMRLSKLLLMPHVSNCWQISRAYRERLIAVVLQADPQAHLDIVWGHNEFGKMNWREWLLFARVHTLDHARQMQAIAAALSSIPEP